MPLQNRVTPRGEIIATPARGRLMGNRGGRLHTPDRELTRRRWASRAWICCLLEFKARHRKVMAPDSYTELFFLDEATALAAGHRPCFECRREDAVRFATRFAKAVLKDGKHASERASAGRMDTILHSERHASSPHRKQLVADIMTLPAGVFIESNTTAMLHHGDGRCSTWAPDGYAKPQQVDGVVRLLTPPSIVAVIAAGYRPAVHESASLA